MFDNAMQDIWEDGKELQVRYTLAYKPMTKEPDVVWPEVMTYRNFLAGIFENKDIAQYNFLLKNGNQSAYEADCELSLTPLENICMCRKVVMWYDPHMSVLRGL